MNLFARIGLVPMACRRMCSGNLKVKHVHNLMRQVQRSQENITGYFGGYISKAQPIGKYELSRSIATLPLLRKKLLERKSKSSYQLAH
eukprot:4884854-Karenia_brevis.AAC.1